MKCPACSTLVPDASRFCAECGASLASSAIPTVTADTPSSPPSAGAPAPGSRPTPQASPSPTDTDPLHGRFAPGARLADRYRIITLLGRGGMGEVYRADDLELGQSIALKFLPERVAADPVALDRFRQEVRLARRVTHTNVCRIHDLATAEGQVFLTMEFVDGEDLGKALHRLGRPSADKAVEMARQICLGLAAAHDAGVVHRDLKPANLMIDGRGRVRILDFGIAGLEEHLHVAAGGAGTPAYMAPELFKGGRATVRSDIYALGLVLYELFTGHRAFDARDRAELRRQHETGSPRRPSTQVDNLDPAVERIILRCLKKDPADRPPTVYAVLAALPGKDPLAAAMAAGETPSPELVAQGSVTGALQPRRALACVGTVLVLLAIILALPNPGLGALGESAARLSLKAEEILASLGYNDLPPHHDVEFATHPGFQEALRQAGHTPTPADVAGTGALYFWARWNPGPMLHADFHRSFPELHEPPQALQGAISTLLDVHGRLIGLAVVPDASHRTNPAPATEMDWTRLLDAAGLAPEGLTSSVPDRLPPVRADAYAAWKGSLPGAPQRPVTFQAASLGGRPIHFSVTDDEGHSTEVSQDGVYPPSFDTIPNAYTVVLWSAITLVSIPMALRNLRLGRGDRRGAVVLGLLAFGAYVMQHALNSRLDQAGLVYLLDDFLNGRSLGHALVHSVPLGFQYLALEPYVRRLWPGTLVSWARVVRGRVRDPLFGRDLLFGSVIGVACAAFLALAFALGTRLGWVPPDPEPASALLTCLSGDGKLLGYFPHALGVAVIETLYALILALILHLFTRRLWLTIALTGTAFVVEHFLLAYRFVGIYGAGAIGIASTLPPVLGLFRFGLVAALAGTFVVRIATMIPATFDLAAWYARPTIVGLGVVLALVAYGFFVSLGGERLLRDMLDDG